jgi:alkylhydroperoxidase/carboxymuconolactone decarboxylase family protein YurZ
MGIRQGELLTESEKTLRNDATDERTRALACIAAAIAIGATSTTLRSLTDAGLLAGATTEEILGTLFAVGPVVGSARLVKAAPELARAIGYEIDHALESYD